MLIICCVCTIYESLNRTRRNGLYLLISSSRTVMQCVFYLWSKSCLFALLLVLLVLFCVSSHTFSVQHRIDIEDITLQPHTTTTRSYYTQHTPNLSIPYTFYRYKYDTNNTIHACNIHLQASFLWFHWCQATTKHRINRFQPFSWWLIIRSKASFVCVK